MKLFNRNPKINYKNLITILEKGDEEEIPNLLWQPKQQLINYLPVTISTIQKLKRTVESDNGLKIHQRLSKGRYELIIFKLPRVAAVRSL